MCGLLLSRLEHVRKSGKGWIARCPAHADKSASLSVTEADGGKILVHCFAGCSALDVVQAVGLALADLFPEPLMPTTPEERRAARRAALHADWDAALGVLAREATILLIAARRVAGAKPLEPEDADRLGLAIERIDSARQVLHGR
jgi:CHC2 zinc finger